MPLQDFLFTFRADYKQAMADVTAFARYVQQVDKQLNAAMNRMSTASRGANPLTNLGATATKASTGVKQLTNQFRLLDRELARQGAVGGGGFRADTLREAIAVARQLRDIGADPRAGRMLNIYQEQFAKLTPIVKRSSESLLDFVRSQQATINMQKIVAPGKVASPQVLGNAFGASLELQRRGLAEGGQAANFFRSEIDRLPSSYDRATASFGHHARRIAEGILLYDTFGRAVQAVANQIQLIGTLAREEIRFEAVVGDLNEQQQGQFTDELRRVAEQTNTPLDQLVSQMDSVGFAFATTGDSVEAYTRSIEFMDSVGKVTNITQRSLATETENLLGIMTVTGDKTNEFADRLGRITEIGGRSSVGVQAVIDILNGAGQAAERAGFDMDLLGTIGVEMFRELRGTMSGGEIASMFKTIFGRFGDPQVQDSIEQITGGVIKFRDELGNMRDGTTIFLELFGAIRSGVLDSRQAQEALDQIIPPLNPAARPFIESLTEVIPDALDRLPAIMGANSDALDALNDKLVSGPAEQFSRAIIALQGAFAELFNAEVLSGMESFAGIISGIASALDDDLGGSAIATGVKLLTLLTVFRTIIFLGKQFTTFLIGGRARMEALAIAMGSVSSAAAVAPLRAYGSSVTNVGTNAVGATGRIDTLRSGIKGLARVLAAPLSLIIAFEFIQNVPEIVDSFKAQLNQEMSSGLVDRNVLDAAFAELTNFEAFGIDFTALARLDPIFGDAAAGAANLSSIQFDNVENLAAAMIQLDKEGKLSAESQKVLDDAIKGANGGISSQLVTVEEILAAYNEWVLSSEEVTEGISHIGDEAERNVAAWQGMSAAQRVAGQTAANLTVLNEEIAQSYEDLRQRLQDGEITQQEYAAGQQQIADVSQMAAEVVAAAGEQIGQLPQFLGAAAEGQEALTKAVYDWILAGGDNLPAIRAQIEAVAALGISLQDAAKKAADNPILITIGTRNLRRGRGEVSTQLTRQQFEQRFNPAGQDPLGIFSSFTNRLFGDSAARQAEASLQDQLDEFLGELFGPANAAAGNTLFGTGAEAAAREPQQTGILDLGELSPAVLGQIIAIAQAAQARVIAAGGVVDTDETTAVFKDAAFLQLISGLDQRFLQQAIEELTEVERRRLELEQSRLQDVTRSTVVQTGPIQSLISAPVLAAGGGVLTGQGLNADPRLGNFTINVPINWSGMDLPQLQEFIYRSIAQAWIDAGRGT